MRKKNRLTGVEIRSIRSPHRVHGGLFSLSISSGVAKEPRCACVVSKKAAAKAIARNTIKRRCRVGVMKAIETLPAGTYVLYAKKNAYGASSAEISADIARLFKEARSARNS